MSILSGGVRRASAYETIPGLVANINFGSLDPTNDIVLNGNDIITVRDQAGNGWDFEQTTAVDQPLYVPNAYDGRAVARFNGTTHHMLGPSGFLAGTVTAIYAVLKVDTPPSNTGFLLAKYGITSARNYGFFSFSSTPVMRSFARDASNNAIAALVNANNNLAIAGATRSDGSTTVSFENETDIALGTYNSPDMSGGNQPALGVGLDFGTTTPTGNYYKGDGGQLLFYSIIPSAAQDTIIKGSLGEEWGIQL